MGQRSALRWDPEPDHKFDCVNSSSSSSSKAKKGPGLGGQSNIDDGLIKKAATHDLLSWKHLLSAQIACLYTQA
jgi:hypothetical protein